MRAALYFHTLRRLRPIQVHFQLRNRFFRPQRNRFEAGSPRVRRGLRAIPFLSVPGAAGEDGTFRFLNAVRPASQPLDWSADEMPKLWRYNLHYFDYLLDEQLSSARKAVLIDDWIERNPAGKGDGWEPYPTSLRIVNWAKYFLASGIDGVRREWLTSLHHQALWLEDRLEYHLLANHLLKNAVAMIFAGAVFDGAAAARWRRLGARLFCEQIDEQFLSDGGHYERSPMYHSICLLDVLDVLALSERASGAACAVFGDQLREHVRMGLQFLADTTLPDGEIPSFNDAAFGIAPSPTAILAHARAVMGWQAPAYTGGLQLIDKPASGYFGLRHGRDALLVDCGEIGPDYQPGHAHCDTLSYELALNGSRVVVDSGVFDYESGARRTAARGTAGHNTVQVDGAEQSEIWGVFRVARRARPLSARIGMQAGTCVFEGAHDGYRRLRGSPVHHRRIEYRDGAFNFIDTIEGTGTHLLESRIRLHPDYKTVMHDGYAGVTGAGGVRIARIEFLGQGVPEIRPARYFPEFGRELGCDCVVISARSPLPARLQYRIVKEAQA